MPVCRFGFVCLGGVRRSDGFDRRRSSRGPGAAEERLLFSARLCRRWSVCSAFPLRRVRFRFDSSGRVAREQWSRWTKGSKEGQTGEQGTTRGHARGHPHAWQKEKKTMRFFAFAQCFRVFITTKQGKNHSALASVESHRYCLNSRFTLLVPTLDGVQRRSLLCHSFRGSCLRAASRFLSRSRLLSLSSCLVLPRRTPESRGAPC